MRPRLLDLFCGAGGAAVGYHRAGFDVTGVDVKPQPRYPFAFVQADALDYLAGHGHEYDAVHASPPCQAYLRYWMVAKDGRHPDLLGPTRAALLSSGRPWVIENVVGAPFAHYVQLCGTMFGLRVYRHRRFETSWLLMQPEHPPHLVKIGSRLRQPKAHFLAGGWVSIAGNIGSFPASAMGIDWMTGDELSQAIPPAYTEWIGKHLLAVVEAGTPAA